MRANAASLGSASSHRGSSAQDEKCEGESASCAGEGATASGEAAVAATNQRQDQSEAEEPDGGDGEERSSSEADGLASTIACQELDEAVDW